MLNTPRGFRGMITAPHHLAAEAGLRVLREGGNAAEAMIAAAAAIAVVYPHMNSIGGDSFWLLAESGRDPVGIDACGATGAAVDAAFYRDRGHAAIPPQGPLAANTVAGTVSGWGAALKVAAAWGGRLPLSRLLDEAIHHGESGIAVTASQTRFTGERLAECRDLPGFAPAFLVDGKPPATGARFRQPALAATLGRIAREGCEGYYRGDLARAIAADLAAIGSPMTGGDLARHEAKMVTPLRIDLASGAVFNMPPPTQGVASLMILGIFERLGLREAEGFAWVHGLIESTKRAFRLRDRHVTDPAHMTIDPRALLEPASIAALAAEIDPARAAPWPAPPQAGDTIWMGCIDGAGRCVSFIQSIYWDFGSGVVLPQTGILWQNRGIGFALDPAAVNALMPGRKPFHTLNPAFARLADGRDVVYGTMGGEGQPQTQAMILTRLLAGQAPQAAVTAPRWLLGRTWGTTVTKLRIESRFDAALIDALRAAGHDLEVTEPFSDLMGHAGMIARHGDGMLEGGADPRSDGAVGAC